MKRLAAVVVGLALVSSVGACRGQRQAAGDASPAPEAPATPQPPRGAGLGDAGVSARAQARDARRAVEEAERKAAEEAGVDTSAPQPAEGQQ